MNRRHPERIKTVAILGGGPAASTLATLLARAGLTVAIWHQPKHAPLIVGESLVPAIVPLLQKLGIEEEVRAFSTFKPGATFNLSDDVNFSFFFHQLTGATATYAYNVPRDRFDETLLTNAQRAGARVIEARAAVERVAGTDRVQLTRETLAKANGFLADSPDLLVDATGRARLLPNLLAIPSREGGRKDTALFAHVDRAQLDHTGHVHTTRLDHGWSWRIPLPGRVSLGMVIGAEHLPQFGATKEARYDNLLKQDSVLSAVASDAQRLTPVMEYVNYQLVSARMVGDGWALLGDTAGFIDPVFSSGLFLGMQGAWLLAEAIRDGSPAAFQRYQHEATHHLETWHEIVDYFYSGRLFTCFKVGQKLRNTLLVRLAFPHINKHLGRIFSGAASTAPYSVGLLRFAMKYGLKDEDPGALRIR
ncbi:MAG: tryptophan 7-halogenase [Verrucomicrobiae bacterium]|nr:tryptophan 7-halogenase [Verrucomicrobiae bacterium]